MGNRGVLALYALRYNSHRWISPVLDFPNDRNTTYRQFARSKKRRIDIHLFALFSILYVHCTEHERDTRKEMKRNKTERNGTKLNNFIFIEKIQPH